VKSTSAQSATSLPRAPRDDVGKRSVRYLIMMGIRVACFVLMVLVQPFGWYTWLFAAAAIFLPYIAVVLANVGQDGKAVPAVNPERAIEAPTATASAPPPEIFRFAEPPRPGAPAPVATPDQTVT
jgi:hypothetical protein